MRDQAEQPPMTTRPRHWRRILRRTALGLLVALLAAALTAVGYGAWLWQRLQQEQGIEHLDWQGLEVGSAGLRLQRLEIGQRSASGSLLRLQAEGLHLAWRLHPAARPELPILRVQRLALDWPAAATTTSPATTPIARADLERLASRLGWLPQRIRVERFAAALPCPRGQCDLHGTLALRHGGPALLPLSLELQLQRQQRYLRLNGELQGRPDDLRLQLEARLDEQPPLQLHSRLSREAAGQRWEGRLELPGLPDTAVLRDWLGEWLELPELPGDLPGELLAQARWRLQLPGERLDVDLLAQAAGALDLDLRLPAPWPVPGLGAVQGELHAGLHGEDGRWQARRLHADLQLLQPRSAWLAELPAALHPQSLRLQLQPLATTAPETPADVPLALQLTLGASGALNLELSGELHAWLRPDWALQLQAGRLQARAAHLALGGHTLDELHADLRLDARLDARRLDASLASGSQLHLGRLALAGADLQLERLHGSPAGLQLAVGLAPDTHWRLHGPLPLQVGRLRHPQLQPQGWRWQGRVEASAQALNLDGRLGNDADLGLAVQLRRAGNGGLALQGRLAELDLATGNPLAGTLAAWPALLELGAGRLAAHVSLRLDPGHAEPRGDLALQLDEVAGIYDRSELSGLTGRLEAEMHGDRLFLELPTLRLERLNPGIPLGPLLLRASYQAALGAPLAGRLQLWQADSGLLGGQLHTEPARLDLASPAQRLVVQLRGLELAELLGVYPAEGLSGSGSLDGRLPLRFDDAGLHVEEGRIAARAPGGVLRLRSERIRAFARSNPALQLATTALEDFRYDRLESEVSYAPRGQLLLGLRLHGHNPALEGGRPVNLTINLEENVPSLLTSLQLSGRVNEAIQRRVQQRLPPRP